MPSAAQSLKNFKGDHLSVRMFGARGTGTGDQTPALQDAISTAIGLNVALHIPAGEFRHTGLTINGPLMLYGRGKHATKLTYIGGGAPSLLVMGVDETHRIQKVLLADLWMEGDPAVAANGLEMAFVDSSDFRNLLLQNHGADGVNIGFGFVLDFHACEALLNRGNGYRFDKTIHDPGGTDDQNAIRIHGGRVVGNYGRGIRITGGNQNVISGVDFEANHYEAVLAERVYGLVVRDNTFENNGREQNADTIKSVGIGTDASFGISIRDNRVYGSGSQTGVPNAYNGAPASTWSINLDYAYNSIIDGNSFGNSYAGYLKIGSNCVGTLRGLNYSSGESTHLEDNGINTIQFGNDKYNSAILKATIFQHFIDTNYYTADFQQSIWRSRKNNPVTHALTAAADQQASVLLQNHATAHATIAGGIVTAIVIDNGGFYGAQTATAAITGDGAGATLGSVTMSGGKVTAIAVSAGGTGYTTATVEITPANQFQIGRSSLGGSPAATDVAAFWFDVINAWNVLEILINGNLAMVASGGKALFGTHAAFDGSTLVQVNGTATVQGALKAVTAAIMTWLAGSGTRMLTVDNSGNVGAASVPAGTVTSVALTVPSILSVSGSPITGAGTLAVTLAAELANLVFAGPTSGGAAAPTFRALVTADFPTTVAANTMTIPKLTGGGANGFIQWDATGRIVGFTNPT